jgi:predicted transposase YdaD
MEQEYNIPIKTDLGKEVNIMCNLSEGIEEAGIRKGRIEGERRGRAEEKNEIILNMHKNNFTLEQIALATANTPEEIKEILKNAELMPV